MFQIDLVEKCKRNDRRAQLKLYRQYCQGMYRVAMRYLKNADDAEDVLQEAFIKAFQKIDQYKGEVSFGAWLKKIVINKCIDFLKAKELKVVELKEGYMQVAVNDDWTVSDDVTYQEVLLAMDNLTEKYRSVIQLFLLEGYDHQEISEILNISSTACRTRLLRGKGQLKLLLKSNKYVTGS
ncbi:RNA polymerase sigma factor [Arenibacter amylolyticus]|uniref:RNA polymerase sigma factor n=1 Tax=Arenibacter amylolyticus TaxID=1406873 RepID=UPI000A387472|nr:RNA polymerase sigma factor [Arenibacter amylolyticus]